MTLALHNHVSSLRRRGFTLLEILIIALVISILSGIAVFNIQTFVDNNKRKATIGEVRQLSQAISFARDDIGYLPKLCFLTESRFSPRLASTDGVGNITGFHPDFQIYGANFATINPTVPLWKGPYMGVATARGGAAQGVGGIAFVETNDPSGGALPRPPEGGVLVWPADSFGNPYVVYAMKWEFDSGLGRYRRELISQNSVDYAEAPNATLAVVSYGRNRFPGGGDSAAPGDITSRNALRLYTESTATPPPPTPAPKFRMLNHPELTQAMADVWDDDMGLGANVPGIIQAGSDDVIFEF